MKILALDLGTKTGWALGDWTGPVDAGTRVLATAAEVKEWRAKRLDRTCDPRVSRLYTFIRTNSPDIIVFEDVEFTSYTKQTQLWASLRAAVWLSAGPNTLLECVPVTTLKKFATGHGGATKEMMRAALIQQKQFLPMKLDDNAVDAVWILAWAREILVRRKQCLTIG